MTAKKVINDYDVYFDYKENAEKVNREELINLLDELTKVYGKLDKIRLRFGSLGKDYDIMCDKALKSDFDETNTLIGNYFGENVMLRFYDENKKLHKLYFTFPDVKIKRYLSDMFFDMVVRTDFNKWYKHTYKRKPDIYTTLIKYKIMGDNKLPICFTNKKEREIFEKKGFINGFYV